MQIKIAERLKPFTHLPGQFVPVLKTSFAVKPFPEKVELYSLKESQPKLIQTLFFSVKGPVEQFTVILNLEKKKIEVFGIESRGRFQYEILASSSPFIRIKKAPEGFNLLQEPLVLKEEISPLELTRLSLGSSKKGDMPLIRSRQNLQEILPYWLFLGQMIPSLPYVKEGTLSLLDKRSLKSLFLAGFEGLFCPRAHDREYQGFDCPPVLKNSSPLPILSEAVNLILSLFIEERGQQLNILTNPGEEFHSGRLLDVPFFGGKLSFEWSKKQLKKLFIEPSSDGELNLNVAKNLKSCRFQNETRVLCPFLIHFKAGQKLVLDRFQH
jgi:hypothetical protein